MNEILPIEMVGRDPRPLSGKSLEINDPDLVSIDRIRYIGDSYRTFADLSYAYGTNTQGERVSIAGLPGQFPNFRAVKPGLYRFATAYGVHLNRLCHGHLTNVLSLSW